MAMDKDTTHQVIAMIRRRINDSHAADEALSGDGLHLQLQREQEYGKRRALLDLWEELNDALTDTH